MYYMVCEGKNVLVSLSFSKILSSLRGQFCTVPIEITLHSNRCTNMPVDQLILLTRSLSKAKPQITS